MDIIIVKYLLHPYAVCLIGFDDLYADVDNCADIYIAPHDTVKISAGIAVELPKNTFGAVFARSGLASKQGLRPANCVGVIDEDYRGVVIVALHNDTNDFQRISHGDRIAQLVVIPYISEELVISDLSNTDRQTGGFGSTGR